MTKLAWTGGCGTSPDAALTCPFGTSNVSVSASNSGVAFSPAVTMAVTVTNFSVAVSPGSATVSAGQSAAFQVTVTPQGGAFGSAIKLGCPVMPQGANCSFSPASVVPGADSATSVMTITTTGHAPATAAGSKGGPWGVAVFAALISACALGAGLMVVAWRRPRQMGLSGRRAWRLALGAAVVLGAARGEPCVKNVGNVPVATIFPASLAFPNQGVGTNSAAKTVTLANTGAVALAITSVSAAGDFSQTNTCGILVAPGSRVHHVHHLRALGHRSADGCDHHLEQRREQPADRGALGRRRVARGCHAGRHGQRLRARHLRQSGPVGPGEAGGEIQTRLRESVSLPNSVVPVVFAANRLPESVFDSMSKTPAFLIALVLLALVAGGIVFDLSRGEDLSGGFIRGPRRPAPIDASVVEPRPPISITLDGVNLLPDATEPPGPVRLVARTITFALSTDRFHDVQDAIGKWVAAHHASIVGEEGLPGRVLMVTLTVPPDEAEAARAGVPAIGTVQRESAATEDVTMSHRALLARIETARLRRSAARQSPGRRSAPSRTPPASNARRRSRAPRAGRLTAEAAALAARAAVVTIVLKIEGR